MLIAPKIQAKILSHSERLCFGRGSVVRPHSNGKWLRDIQHSMSMTLDTRFHIWFIMEVYYKMREILLQNVTIILLQNASGFLLQIATVLVQNATIITKCNDFVTKSNSYYKMRHLLQIATVQWIENCILFSFSYSWNKQVFVSVWKEFIRATYFL